jgi:hypothetical protein
VIKVIFNFVKASSHLFQQVSIPVYLGNPYSLKAPGDMGYNLSIYADFVTLEVVCWRLRLPMNIKG